MIKNRDSLKKNRPAVWNSGPQNLHEKLTHNPWLKLSEGANPAKEDKNYSKMRYLC